MHGAMLAAAFRFLLSYSKSDQFDQLNEGDHAFPEIRKS